MRLCDKCGAHNADDRLFCIDCGTKLGKPLSEEQEQALAQQLDDKLDTLYDKGDPLRISLLDKIVGGADALGAVALIVTVIVRACTRSLPEGWGAVLLIGLLAFFLSAVEALFPQLGWKLAKIHLWADGTDGLTPNSFYRFGRNLDIWIMLGLGVFILTVLIRGEV